MSKSVFFHGRAPSTAGVVVTASAATRAIDAASVTNTTVSDATLTLWHVPNGEARGDGNVIVQALTVTAGSTLVIAAAVNQAITKNAQIFAEASAANALTLMISGRAQ